MVSSLSLPVDPYKILGVAPGASLHEIRGAYRTKAKLYHPDAGGDDWMFHILNQAYEYLSAARLAQAIRPEPAPSRSYQNGSAHAPTHESAPHDDEAADTTEVVRPGEKDVSFDPDLIVEVEKLYIRYRPADVWQLAEGGPDDRFLSCSLNVAWPESSRAAGARSIPDADEHLRRLAEVFEEIRGLTPAQESSDHVEDGRFTGWFSYAGMNQASVAYRRLRESLHAQGFRLKHWTRDLIIPRAWR